ncbi:MAG TPA: EAL domain-containing protein [Acidimicrobiales bacterium]|nr:EAL domain-containing protein [Acidimicrobiales bacterium]
MGARKLRDRRRVTRRRAMALVPQFAVLSLVPLVALGLVLSYTVRTVVTNQYLASEARSDELSVDAMATTLLAGVNLHQGTTTAQAQSINSVVSRFYSIEFGTNSKIATVTAWSPTGQVFYSTDSKLIGKKVTVSHDVRSALAGRDVTVLVPPSFAGNTFGQTAIETTVPIRLGGHIIGAVQSFAPFATFERSITRSVNEVELQLAIGLLALWACLFPIVIRASLRLRRQAQENERLALRDALTGVANRTLFRDRLQLALADGHRRDESVALLVIDLDRFKDVNDTLGHAEGDHLLCEVATRLRSVLRESDTLARLGGDEFAVVLPNTDGLDGARRVAVRLCEAVEAPITLHGLSITPQASIGIALYPHHGVDPDLLLSRADAAMYEAKQGRTRVEAFTADKDRVDVSKLTMASEMRDALHSGEIVCHFQPLADVPTGRVRGMEALVRWDHPALGMLPPAEFLPVAERAGLMRPLTERVLDLALAQCHAWRHAGHDVFVSVNLPAEALQGSWLPGVVASLLQRHGVPARGLELEITEGVLLADPHRARAVLDELRSTGVSVALDDFGTGYSSLSYLAQLPVDKIKIDRSLVANIATSPADETIVSSVVELGRRLGLAVLAEGVETESVWNRLARLGCAQAQGYYLSRPLPADAAGRCLADATGQELSSFGVS